MVLEGDLKILSLAYDPKGVIIHLTRVDSSCGLTERYLASGHHDGSVQLWGFGDGARKYLLNNVQTQGILCLQFNTDGARLASGDCTCTHHS